LRVPPIYFWGGFFWGFGFLAPCPLAVWLVVLYLARPLLLWFWWGCGLVGLVLLLVWFGRWFGWLVCYAYGGIAKEVSRFNKWVMLKFC